MCEEHDTRDYATGSGLFVAGPGDSSEGCAGRLGAPYAPEGVEGVFSEVRELTLLDSCRYERALCLFCEEIVS